MRIYVVKDGDYLQRIAREQLGDAAKWPQIAHINNLEYPYRIYPNQILEVPEKDSPLTIVITPEQKQAAQIKGAASDPQAKTNALSPAFIALAVAGAAFLFWSK